MIESHGEARPSRKLTSEATSEFYQREQEAWQNVLGTRVEVKPLPDSVTPEVTSNLERIGLGLRYIPALDLGSIEYLRDKGVDKYLIELQRKYPKWKPLENLLDTERADHTVPRNLERHYWELINNGNVAFPVLPGQWIAVETVDKPLRGEKYAKTSLSERLGFQKDRFDVSWNDAHTAIEREKPRILSDIGLSRRSADIRMLEALEWNLLGNREGWGETNTYEWTNTEFRLSDVSFRLFVGRSRKGEKASGRGFAKAYAKDRTGERPAFFDYLAGASDRVGIKSVAHDVVKIRNKLIHKGILKTATFPTQADVAVPIAEALRWFDSYTYAVLQLGAVPMDRHHPFDLAGYLNSFSF